jgi:hypothetical protein
MSASQNLEEKTKAYLVQFLNNQQSTQMQVALEVATKHRATRLLSISIIIPF